MDVLTLQIAAHIEINEHMFVKSVHSCLNIQLNRSSTQHC